MTQHDDEFYIIHIAECIQRVEEDTASRVEFFRDRRYQDAVLRNLQVMAESTQRLSDRLKSQRPEVDWRGLAGFRNVLVHDYTEIDLPVVWQIIETHLPSLKIAIVDWLHERGHPFPPVPPPER